jgi:hypothetical protein
MIWDGRPLTSDAAVELETLGLLTQLFAKPLGKEDVVEFLNTSPTVHPQARQLALSLLNRYHEETDPERYYQASWALLRQPYLNRVQYYFALRQAHSAWEKARENGRYQIALGIGQYRTGQYQEAVTTFKKRDNGTPEVLAFLTMAQHRADQHQDAATTLERLRQTMKKPEWVTNAEAQSFLREAEALLHDTAPEPKP